VGATALADGAAGTACIHGFTAPRQLFTQPSPVPFAFLLSLQILTVSLCGNNVIAFKLHRSILMFFNSSEWLGLSREALQLSRVRSWWMGQMLLCLGDNGNWWIFLFPSKVLPTSLGTKCYKMRGQNATVSLSGHRGCSQWQRNSLKQ